MNVFVKIWGSLEKNAKNSNDLSLEEMRQHECVCLCLNMDDWMCAWTFIIFFNENDTKVQNLFSRIAEERKRENKKWTMKKSMVEKNFF